jgi:hypothetical protein
MRLSIGYKNDTDTDLTVTIEPTGMSYYIRPHGCFEVLAEEFNGDHQIVFEFSQHNVLTIYNLGRRVNFRHNEFNDLIEYEEPG